MAAPFNRRLITRFGLVGMVATLAYFITASLLGSDLVGFSAGIASIIGFAVSLGISYAGHAAVTYQTGGNHRRYGPRFLIVSALLMSLMAAGSYALVELLHFNNTVVALGVSLLYPPLSLWLHTIWSFVPPANKPAADL